MFRKLKAEKKLTFPVEFEEDKIPKICLDIPDEGIEIEGWTLEPMTDPPQVYMYIYRCSIKI